MYLEGQARRWFTGASGVANERGYAMAALLVMLSVMAILMTALLPVWRHQAIREKEAELAFRGEQYARAIYLFRAKNGNQSPPNVDVLVDGRYLRKKYKDPVTGEDFQPIFGGQQPQQQPGPQGRGTSPLGRGTTPLGSGLSGAQRGAPTPTSVGSGLSGAQSTGPAGTTSNTGLVTVQSKSKEASIRIYNNASHYNEWQFLYNARGRGGVPGAGGADRPGPGTGRGTPGRGGPVGSPFPGGGRGPGPGGRGLTGTGRGPG